MIKSEEEYLPKLIVLALISTSKIELVSFIDTLLKDISKYKTLPTNALRKLSLRNKDYNKLIENIIDLRRRLGDGYLNVILNRIEDIENDVIIAVGNIKDLR